MWQVNEETGNRRPIELSVLAKADKEADDKSIELKAEGEEAGALNKGL